MAAAATASSASFPAAPLRRDGRGPSRVTAATTAAAEASLAAVPPPPPVPTLRVAPESLQRESGYLVEAPRETGAEGNGFVDGAGIGGPGAMEYLTSVLSSKVYDVAIESPLQLATKLSDRLGVNLWVKREDLQPVFSFKLRGAYNMMAKLSREQLERGVICSSAGNHAQGVALSAQRLGCDAVIVMPVTTPEIKVKIIGVEPSDANAMALSLCHGKRVTLEHVGGFADGVAVKAVGEETFRLCKELVDGIVMNMFEEKRNILEPAGALALAGAEAYCKFYDLKGETVVAITSGANMNFDRLRIVTELADVGQMNITEFKYRYDANTAGALVLYSVGIYTDDELGAMVDRMESAKLETFNLTDNDLAKDHLRYFIGGRSEVKNELVYRFIFPERPGALMKFLDIFSPRWNISLFHYRAQGEAGANVLVGIQVPPEDVNEFRSRADNLGFEYMSEMNNEIYRLLLCSPKI
ncbi:hypothetical protein PR202_gb11189 [Eleusine coracana subsp. coracana]|uniref:threonine ammonia-lyase n=1 Tax=Eleusine coracana subsp. coracana TaxID=191504 RepID=A0AAV5EM36_ELECO|nr:hypothetical protein PR202_gb11189 [Eleusine coracana subsp. coracana]